MFTQAGETTRQLQLTRQLENRLLNAIRGRLPRKSFGYFISDGRTRIPSDFVLFEHNIRNSDIWKRRFESYGKYFVDHDDAGFVADPKESWKLQKEIWNRGFEEVGVFHSHLRHPASFSQIDFDMHRERFAHLWHMVISMRNPELPQLRAFEISRDGVQELRLLYKDDGGTASSTSDENELDIAIPLAKEVLKLDGEGRPKCKDRQRIFRTLVTLLRSADQQAIKELLVEGFLRDSQQRYDKHIAGNMALLSGVRFEMGTPQPLSRHFCGESPSHTVELSSFGISETLVTNEMFNLFANRQSGSSMEERRRPVVGVSWFDAAVFALWMGCRLPTEAEWEFACGGGSLGDWCCEEEQSLPRHAWYSQNSQGGTQPVRTRAANSFGLFDLHGNVWEWCQDDYEPDYYGRSPIVNPCNYNLVDGNASSGMHKVCRGGSFHALSEMCRTRFRLHEPPAFWAEDLGFRLAVTAKPRL